MYNWGIKNKIIVSSDIIDISILFCLCMKNLEKSGLWEKNENNILDNDPNLSKKKE